jgi:hypothetical protein
MQNLKTKTIIRKKSTTHFKGSGTAATLCNSASPYPFLYDDKLPTCMKCAKTFLQANLKIYEINPRPEVDKEYEL